MNNIQDWIALLYTEPKLLGMGHAQSEKDLNLGLGWLYYSLVRMQRSQRVVVIGSLRGFVPMIFAKALKDNQDSGQLTFIDPSLVDDFWKNPEQVKTYFERFGLDNIQHYLFTTQAFIQTDSYQALRDIDVLFIDGYHSHEQAKFDHLAFESKLSQDALVLFHDSTSTMNSGIYGNDKRYQHTVIDYINELKLQPNFQVFDFAYGTGVSLVKRTA